MNTSCPPAANLPAAGTPAPDAPCRRPHPTKLFVEVTTRCNLRCAMCVKQSPGQGLVEGDMTLATFERLAPAFPHLEAVVLNGIGEPLLHRQLERFVELARRDLPASGWVGFQTNGQLLGPRRAEALVAAGVDRICISADAVAPEQLRALRDGAQLGRIEAAAGSLHRAARGRARPLALGLEFVAMRDNLRQLPELVRWASHHRFGFLIVTHMLPYDGQAEGQVAFDIPSDRALAIYREWRDRAAADGVDLRRYPGAFMRITPSAADGRAVDYVRRMVADAAAQGVSLKVDALLRFDEERLRRVQEAFAEAAEVARAEGVDLRLPATVPTQDRRCDFVEEGGAFVSWDGGLHPCYFLWHRYRCHLGGTVKQVQPRTFGSAAREELTSVWQAEAWSSFRGDVLRYDFPFCYDCNLALCDYVQAGEFEQDCHLSRVPCAACLWCTGLFQCLR